MQLFQSEEDIDRWFIGQGVERGESLSIGQVWELSKRWYAGRLAPEYRGRTVTEAEDIFRQVGLTGPFWSAGR